MKVVLEKGAIMPTKGHSTDAGFDLYSRTNAIIDAHTSYSFDTGVHIELPDNTCGLIVSKSGLNMKHDITSTGLIDVGYTGSIVVKLYNNSNHNYYVEKGDKISQLVILPIVNVNLEQVDELNKTERGNNGFGSTGK